MISKIHKIPIIAVLITSHNRSEKTLKCLNHLFEQKGLNKDFRIEVFLVDDGSTDDTKECISLLFSQVNIIQGDGNLFWNGGMLKAWKIASITRNYDYYLWLNDDTYLNKIAIIELYNFQKSCLDDHIISGSCCDLEGNHTYGIRDISGKTILPNNEGINGALLNGNCVLISKYVFSKVGYLDKMFKHAIGDYDYGLRAVKLGVKLVTTPTYIAICEKEYYLPKWKNRKYSFLARLSDLYSAKSYSAPDKLFLYNARHFGLLKAIMCFFSNHLQLLFPN